MSLSARGLLNLTHNVQAEEEKKKAFEKFQAQQKAIMAKHKAGKKKK